MINEHMKKLAGIEVNEAKKPKKVTYSVRDSRGTTKTLEDAVEEITDLYPDAEVEMSGDRIGKSVTHDIYDGRGMSIGSVVVYESNTIDERKYDYNLGNSPKEKLERGMEEFPKFAKRLIESYKKKENIGSGLNGLLGMAEAMEDAWKEHKKREGIK